MSTAEVSTNGQLIAMPFYVMTTQVRGRRGEGRGEWQESRPLVLYPVSIPAIGLPTAMRSLQVKGREAQCSR